MSFDKEKFRVKSSAGGFIHLSMHRFSARTVAAVPNRAGEPLSPLRMAVPPSNDQSAHV